MVPSDNDDSDAAISFSDGRRTPLPPLDDADEIEDDEDERAGPSGLPRRSVYLTPEPPADESDSDSDSDDETDDDLDDAIDGDVNGENDITTTTTSADKGKEVERLPSPPIQAVSA